MNSQVKTVSILTVNQDSLYGQLLIPARKTQNGKAVLVLHGWKSSLKRFPKRVAPLVEAGYTCLVFDMRGHGTTGGDLEEFSAQDHLDDCLAAYDFLAAQQGIDHDQISLLGSSYGGFLAILLSSKRKVANLILVAPSQYPDQDFEISNRTIPNPDLMQYRNQPHKPTDNRALQAVADFQGKILLIQPENDTQVPKQVFADYLAAGGTKVTHKLIQEADHSFYHGDTNQQMIETVSTWMESI